MYMSLSDLRYLHNIHFWLKIQKNQNPKIQNIITFLFGVRNSTLETILIISATFIFDDFQTLLIQK